jgi:hypothetical protein
LPTEGLAVFDGEVAAFVQNDYYVASPQAAYMLAWDARRQRWRALPIANVFAVYRDQSDQLAFSGGAFGVYTLEADPVGVPMPFVLQTPSVRPTADQEVVLQRLYLDLDTQGQDVTLHVISEFTDHPMPIPLNTPGRVTVEYPVGLASKMFAVRLSHSAPSQPITVFGVEGDLYVPGEANA